MNRRRVALFLILLAVVIATIGLLERWKTDNTLDAKLAARTADLEQRFTQSSVLPVLLANDPRVIKAVDVLNTGQSGDVNQLLRLTVENSEVAVAFLMDANGLTIASSNFDKTVSFVGNNYGFRPYFVNAMKGRRSTFFAVGATTGIPGYFISEPVVSGDSINGVVVAKLEPRELPLSWTEDDTVTVISDELGVPILSTESGFLYQPVKPLTEAELVQISNERRYTVSESSTLTAINAKQWRYKVNGSTNSYRASSERLTIEPWTLTVLTPLQQITSRSMRNIAAILAALTIAALLFHAFRQQKMVATERGRTAVQLEQLVEERTRELQHAQNALIAESNFSMLGKMSAAINHEINQPLASMRFDLATLRRVITQDRSVTSVQEKGDYNAQGIVVNLDRTVKRISRVVETLRVLPKQQKSSFTAVDILAVLNQSVDMVRADRKQLSRNLSVDLNELRFHECLVHGNSVLLQQAILNLLYNALDALVSVEDERHADLSAHVSSDSIRIDVRDSGAGIDPLVESVLFEPFESSSMKSEGLGLGLTLARQIVSLHSGTISCERIDNGGVLQNADQKLTVFSIALPIISTNRNM